MSIMKMEQFAERAFRVKLAYIDAAEDLNAGILLGQIVYWYTPDRNGRPKLSVFQGGRRWLAKSREEWHQEIRLSPKQYDRAIRILEKRGLVEVEVRHFNGRKTPHIWLNQQALKDAVDRILTDGEYTPDSILPDGENAFYPMGEMHLPQRSISSISNKELHTETTAETTAHAGARETSAASAAPPATDADVFDAFFVAFGRQPNALQLQKISGHLDDGLEPDLLIEIFKQAALTGAQYPYADAALFRIYKQGIRTLDQYQKAEQERRGSHARDRRDPGRTEKKSGATYKPARRDFSDVNLDDL